MFERIRSALANHDASRVMSDPSPLRPEWLPDDKELESALSSALSSLDGEAATVSLVARVQNTFASRSPSETLVCRLGDGRTLELLCKYPAPTAGQDRTHHGGTAYEATVYRDLLAPLRCSTPEFYGAYVHVADGGTWLFLEYLGPCLRVSQCKDPGKMMQQAAEWIAHFHALNEARLEHNSMDLVPCYDVDYYAGSARVISTWAGQVRHEHRWVPAFCERFQTFADVLLAPPDTIIHGEYYPANVMVRDSTIHPVDWESAARAAGELDLASLIELWDAATIEECVRAYVSTRWPAGPPANFEQRLAAARMHLLLRWLADCPSSKDRARAPRRLELLRDLGQTWGLI